MKTEARNENENIWKAEEAIEREEKAMCEKSMTWKPMKYSKH